MASPTQLEIKVEREEKRKNEIATFILQHMEPNLRFRINQRIPDLRDPEHNAPLKINRLILENNQMLVNDTLYKVKRTQHLHMGPKSKKTTFLDITIKSKNKIFKERLTADINVNCVMMRFAEMFFNHRTKPIKVNHLEITGSFQWYLPKSARFIVQDLKLLHKHFRSNIHDLEPFLSKESFPLETVFLHGYRAEPNVGSYQHEWIEKAEYLQISDSSEKVKWLPTLLALKNSKVHLECHSFGTSSCIEFIQSILDDGREVEAFFTIGCKDYDMAVVVMCEFAKRENAVMEDNMLFGFRSPKFPNMINLPMKDNKKLCIYISKHRMIMEQSFSEWDINICVFAGDN